MNKKISFVIFCGLLAILIFSCKKTSKTVSPAPVDTTKVVKKDTIVPVKVIYNVEIYNQALDTINNTGKKFYNITSGTYSNSVKSPIELAYVYFETTDPNDPKGGTRHVLGSAKADKVKARHGVSSANNTYTEFYKINDGNNSLIYDTISNNKTIAKIFSQNASLAVFEGESNAIGSDQYGWDIGEIIGFKLENGKRGLIKLTTKPTGSKDPNHVTGVVSGKMRFDIKMEK